MGRIPWINGLASADKTRSMYGKVFLAAGESVEDALSRLNKIAKINGLPLGKPLFCKRNHIDVEFYEKPSERKRRQWAIGRMTRLRADNRRKCEREPPEKME